MTTPLSVYYLDSNPLICKMVLTDQVRSQTARLVDYTYQFTVYVFVLDDFDTDKISVIPSDMKTFIELSKDEYPYTTTLVDVIYSIFPNPPNSQKFVTYRLPTEYTIPLYLYKTTFGTLITLEEFGPENPRPPGVIGTEKLFRIFCYANKTNLDLESQLDSDLGLFTNTQNPITYNNSLTDGCSKWTIYTLIIILCLLVIIFITLITKILNERRVIST
ncbi:MAG: hypothetical protein JKX76_02320 [Colwellia sp.]|nr:hypothetical protein [Colwellia sp.]